MTSEQSTRTLTVWRDGSTDTEDRQPRGWVVLIEEVRCPNGCECGEVLGGDVLYKCHVCDGAGVVPVGRGGAYVQYSTEYPVPEEPSLSFFSHQLVDRLP